MAVPRSYLERIGSDLRVIYQLACARGHGDSHQERLENFYSGQSEDYDSFRKKLLPGRESLISSSMNEAQGGSWVDIGAGTGANLDFAGDQVKKFNRVVLLDLSSSLLEVADKKVLDRGLSNVEIVEKDAKHFLSESSNLDLITFSYSLSMMPDWIGVLDEAYKSLRPGGIIAVVDFFVAQKFPEEGRAHHSFWKRHFWPAWFSLDNVYLSPERLQYLEHKFERSELEEGLVKIPYMPASRAPYFLFLGRKPENGN